MSKIPTRRVKSDDCVIHIGRQVDVEKGIITDMGEAYYIHKNEWVEVIPLCSVQQFIAWNKLRTGAVSDSVNLEKAMNALCHELSNKIVKWNWTDNEGRKLPQPYKNPEVLIDLTEEELLWLSTSLTETAQQPKNASAPSA